MMREIALHILDIAENSVSAESGCIRIEVCEDLSCDQISLIVRDNGKGMDEEMLARVTDPFVTTRTTRKVGLGIPLLKAAAEACRGSMEIDSKVGCGTSMRVVFQRSHIDRMPLGDLAGALLTLVVAFPQIDWDMTYCASLNGRGGWKEFNFRSRTFTEVLEDVPLTEPGILAYLRSHLEEGVAEIHEAIKQAEKEQENEHANN
jgi:anti-sigma regulatory factor (Ser/Thr protein kinase)